MPLSKLLSRPSTPLDQRTRARRLAAPICEALEGRTMLNAGTAHLDAAVARNIHVPQKGKNNLPQVIGTITGEVTNAPNGKAQRRVKVQLIDANGNVVQTVKTNFRGIYQLKVPAIGAYVVHEVTPKGFVQTTPTFSTAETPSPTVSGSWSYATGNSDPSNGPVGPYAWDTIAPSGDLPFQSPIVLTGPTTDLSKVLTINDNPSTPTDIINNGHQIQVQYTSKFDPSSSDTITINGTKSSLAQFHYHDPSEHTINGRGFPMEEHFVYISESGAESVVGVFLQLGAPNPALQTILNAATKNLNSTTPNTKTTLSTPIDFTQLLPTNPQGWYYEGSLTTPPLSEVVNWFVYSTPITLSPAQLKQYEAVASSDGFLPNARPIQPTDGRQLNEIDYDVNFQNQSFVNMNFVNTKA